MKGDDAWRVTARNVAVSRVRCGLLFVLVDIVIVDDQVTLGCNILDLTLQLALPIKPVPMHPLSFWTPK
jgi:hypothetical protein